MFSVTTRIIPVATMTMPTMIVPIILLKILAMMEPAIAKITKTIAIQTSDSTSTTDHLNPKRYPRNSCIPIAGSTPFGHTWLHEPAV